MSNNDKRDAIMRLRKLAPKGSTIYCVLRHVSRSGMSRRISFYAIHKGELVYLDGYIARLGHFKLHPTKDGLKVDGCGMDMGFHVVYSTARQVWKGCKPSPRGRLMSQTDMGYEWKSAWL